jgi:glutathione S-transferase
MELFTNPLCPYAHRARLVLAEKNLDARLSQIDLRNKPPRFNELSPHGTLPVLKVGADALWESTVIAEYLEDRFPEPALLPDEPLARARARQWIRFADDRLYADTKRLLLARDPGQQAAARERVHDALRFMEREGFACATANGPYWMGERLTLVDLTFVPWFEQRAALETFRGFVWLEEYPRLLRWHSLVAQRPAVQAQGRPAGWYVEQYAALAG